jgi:hypothetical protein
VERSGPGSGRSFRRLWTTWTTGQVLVGPVVDFEPEAPEVLGFASLVAAVVGADEVAVEPSFAGLDVDAADDDVGDVLGADEVDE